MNCVKLKMTIQISLISHKNTLFFTQICVNLNLILFQCTTETEALAEASANSGRNSSAEASVKIAKPPNRQKNVILGEFWSTFFNFENVSNFFPICFTTQLYVPSRILQIASKVDQKYIAKVALVKLHKYFEKNS